MNQGCLSISLILMLEIVSDGAAVLLRPQISHHNATMLLVRKMAIPLQILKATSRLRLFCARLK